MTATPVRTFFDKSALISVRGRLTTVRKNVYLATVSMPINQTGVNALTAEAHLFSLVQEVVKATARAKYDEGVREPPSPHVLSVVAGLSVG